MGQHAALYCFGTHCAQDSFSVMFLALALYVPRIHFTSCFLHYIERRAGFDIVAYKPRHNSLDA